MVVLALAVAVALLALGVRTASWPWRAGAVAAAAFGVAMAGFGPIRAEGFPETSTDSRGWWLVAAALVGSFAAHGSSGVEAAFSAVACGYLAVAVSRLRG